MCWHAAQDQVEASAPSGRNASTVSTGSSVDGRVESSLPSDLRNLSGLYRVDYQARGAWACRELRPAFGTAPRALVRPTNVANSDSNALCVF